MNNLQKILVWLFLSNIAIYSYTAPEITTGSLASTTEAIETTTKTVQSVLETEAVTSETLADASKPVQFPASLAIDVLKELEKKHQEVTTIYGEFEQLKVSSVFLEEIQSQGKFYYKKPSKFRCDYLPPDESVNIVVNNVAWLYVPEIKQVEKYYFKGDVSEVERLNKMLLGFGASVEDVLDVYQVATVENKPKEHVVALKFTPKRSDESLDFNFIIIWFDMNKLLPQKIIVNEPGDDRTIITINKIKLNTSIKEDLFRPFFPKDVEIIEQI